jgi:two-component system, cell cycle sensor histidine kinase and response regulator CckA
MDEQQNGKEIRILCVEDTEDDFEIISRTLEKTLKEKYLLEWASTAKKGLTLLETHEFDIMLLDYNLPDMNGIEMMKAMRYEGVTIPIILLTGQGDEMVAVNAMKEGAADYITKSDIVGKDTLANAIVHIVAMCDGSPS